MRYESSFTNASFVSSTKNQERANGFTFFHRKFVVAPWTIFSCCPMPFWSQNDPPRWFSLRRMLRFTNGIFYLDDLILVMAKPNTLGFHFASAMLGRLISHERFVLDSRKIINNNDLNVIRHGY